MAEMGYNLAKDWHWGIAVKIYKEYRQDQHFLLPPSLDDFVAPDHDVRIISDVVESMTLSALFSRYEGGGAPAYHPAMMLKVLIYAYSLGVFSSRQISKELKTDTAFMYLSGMQTPDFHTICLFRSQHAGALPGVFVEVVRLCASLGMVELGHVAFDGTKLKANASNRQSKDAEGLNKEMERLKEEMKQMIEASVRIDSVEDKIYPDGDGSEMRQELIQKEKRLKKIEEAKRVLEEEKLKKVNITDIDAPLMRNSHGKIEPAYNGQAAVDHKEQIIVAAAITVEETDNFQLEPMMEQVKNNLETLPDEASADAGYFSYDNLEYGTEKVDLYLPDTLLKALDNDKEGKFRYEKSRFLYDEMADTYTCPEGQVLRKVRKLNRKDKTPMMVYQGDSCGRCPVREKCTKRAVREIFRDGREPLLEAMRVKLRTEEGKAIYNKRMYTVEPVFADMKWNRHRMMMSVRGKVKVNGEFCLMCLVHNVKKIILRAQKARCIPAFRKPARSDTNYPVDFKVLALIAGAN